MKKKPIPKPTPAKPKPAPVKRAKSRAKASSSKAVAETRYRVFAEAFLANNGNKTQAAIAAGCPPKGAPQQGARLFNHEKVQAIIKARQEKTFSDLEITTERILRERARLAFFDPQKLYDENGRRIPIHKLDKDTAAAIVAIEHGRDGVKIRMADKNASLTSLEKQRGLYKVDNEQQANMVVEHRLPKDDIEAARVIAFALAKGAMAIKKKPRPTE